MKTLRVFIAFELPDDTVLCLKKIQSALKQAGIRLRWVQPGNMHLTLKFLGDIPAEGCSEIEAAIDAATDGFKPLNLHLKGLGVFPGIKNARVLWTGLGGEVSALLNFQRLLDNHLADRGFPIEKRSFKAHLTLGRVNQKIDPRHLLDAIRTCGDFEPENFSTHRIVLFKSDLKPTGAVYTPLYSKVFK